MNPHHDGHSTQQGIASPWRNLVLLAKFLEINKHFPTKEESKPLFHWMNSMRNRYKRGVLPAQIISELNALGFKWSVKEAKWYGLAQITIAHIKKGEIPSPTEHPVLYGWLRNSLDQYRNQLLTDDKKKIIEEMQARINLLKKQPRGNTIIVTRMRKLRWEEHFNHLVAFRKVHTKCWPRRSSADPAEKELYKWCSLIRWIYSHRALSDDWVQNLKKIGFQFKNAQNG